MNIDLFFYTWRMNSVLSWSHSCFFHTSHAEEVAPYTSVITILPQITHIFSGLWNHFCLLFSFLHSFWWTFLYFNTLILLYKWRRFKLLCISSVVSVCCWLIVRVYESVEKPANSVVFFLFLTTTKKDLLRQVVAFPPPPPPPSVFSPCGHAVAPPSGSLYAFSHSLVFVKQ